MMDLALRGKGVLVTGGSRGIGREIALPFAREGAHVAICARDAEQLEKTGEIRALGGQAHTMVADLFQEADCIGVLSPIGRRLMVLTWQHESLISEL